MRKIQKQKIYESTQDMDIFCPIVLYFSNHLTALGDGSYNKEVTDIFVNAGHMIKNSRIFLSRTR